MQMELTVSFPTIGRYITVICIVQQLLDCRGVSMSRPTRCAESPRGVPSSRPTALARPTATGNLLETDDKKSRPTAITSSMPNQRGNPDESNVWSLHHLPYSCLHAAWQSLLLKMSGSSSAFQRASWRSNCSILCLHLILSTFSAAERSRKTRKESR